MELIVAVILVTAGDAEQDLFEEGSRFGRHHRVLGSQESEILLPSPLPGLRNVAGVGAGGRDDASATQGSRRILAEIRQKLPASHVRGISKQLFASGVRDFDDGWMLETPFHGDRVKLLFDFVKVSYHANTVLAGNLVFNG